MSSWDGVPWMVGGGAKHSVNVARNVAHAAFGGREGVVNPTDLEVRELAVPGTSIRVFPGTCSIKNQAPSARDEMYVGRLPTQDVVPIVATTSGAGRSDLIVARVENPWEDGSSWSAPADPLVGPYIFTRVISNVPPATTTAAQLGLGQSMIALARIDIPPSTGTIQQEMITDLRQMSTVPSQRDFMIYAPTGTATLTATSYALFPPGGRLDLTVPDWATHAKVRAFLAGLEFGNAPAGSNGNVFGAFRVALIGASSNSYSQSTSFNMSLVGAGVDRGTVMSGAPNLYVAPANRGKAGSIQIQGQRNGGNATLKCDPQSMLSLEVEWVRLTDTNL